MPRYNVTRKTWLDFNDGPRLVRENETIAYDGWPNVAMEPLDEDGRELKAVVDEYQTAHRKLPDTPVLWRAGLNAARDAVEIPEGWTEKRPESIVNLARKLGCSGRCNVTQAIAWIEKELARRDVVAVAA